MTFALTAEGEAAVQAMFMRVPSLSRSQVGESELDEMEVDGESSN